MCSDTDESDEEKEIINVEDQIEQTPDSIDESQEIFDITTLMYDENSVTSVVSDDEHNGKPMDLTEEDSPKETECDLIELMLKLLLGKDFRQIFIYSRRLYYKTKNFHYLLTLKYREIFIKI